MLCGHEVTCRVVILRDLNRWLHPKVAGFHTEDEGPSIVHLQGVPRKSRKRNLSEVESGSNVHSHFPPDNIHKKGFQVHISRSTKWEQVKRFWNYMKVKFRWIPKLMDICFIMHKLWTRHLCKINVSWFAFHALYFICRTKLYNHILFCRQKLNSWIHVGAHPFVPNLHHCLNMT